MTQQSPAPTAPTTPENSPFGWTDVAIVLLLSVLVPGVAALFIDDFDAAAIFVVLLPSQWLGNAIGLALVGRRHRAAEVWFGLPILGRDWGGIGLGLLAFIAIISILGPLAERLDLTETGQVTVDAFASIDAPWLLAAAIINVCVLAPLMEELTYRGVLHGALRRRLGPAPTVTIGALIFALAHVQGLDPGAERFWLVAVFTVVEVFLLSLLLGSLREKDGRIGRAFFAHSAWNTINLIALLSLPYLETGA